MKSIHDTDFDNKIIMFLKNLTFQFPSNKFFKVMFEYVQASCSIKFFRNFISQGRTNERQGILTYASLTE